MTKKKTKLWLIIVSLALTLITAISIITAVKLNDSIKTKEIGWTSYSIGSLNVETGKLEESRYSIRTEDYITLDGFICEISEDAEITYRLFFYDKDKAFIEASDDLTDDFSTVVENAKYVRIVITPITDVEFSLTNISTYAKQLTVTVNK